jgi:crotonobetainyl-CoA:carnitine CoA-transferase CaiB-like acyl-CoA transferase
MSGALAGIRVLDFSTLLPGPLATLMLADAGAEIIKVERAGEGDPKREEPSVFAVLNRGKRSIAIDLKAQGAVDSLLPIVATSDVLVEQFRPGVMERLGLGYERLRSINPRLVYASINGYGARGPLAFKPGHDITYCAENGLLSLNVAQDGTPVLPAALTADIGGGSYPAVVNILMALMARERTGRGCQIEISMFAATMPFLYEAWGMGMGDGVFIAPGSTASTGSSARYGIHRTADGRFIAVAPAEDKFWYEFCQAAGLPHSATRAQVAARIAERSAAEWQAAFYGRDVCCEIVLTVEEALAAPAMRALVDRDVEIDGRSFAALPSIVAPELRDDVHCRCAPDLGADNALLA